MSRASLKPTLWSLATVLVAVAVVVSAAPPTGKYYDHLIIIMFENNGYQHVMKDPNFSQAASLGLSLDNSYGVTHPSQPNYISQVSGKFPPGWGDSNIDLDWPNVADLLEAKNLTWKSYAEDFPGNCFPGSKDGKYYRKHVPLVSMNSVRNDPTRCANIVNAQDNWFKDLEAGNLPNYAYYTPNIENDGHNTGIPYAGNFLKSWLTKTLPLLPARTLLYISWDEDGGHESNHIYTVAIGPMFKAGSHSDMYITQYTALDIVEANWDLGTLSENDTGSPSFLVLANEDE